MTKAICIYGASSENIPELYKEAALECGRLIAEAGAALVCGGGKAGLMRCAIDGALERNGEAIGVLPEFMVKKVWQHPNLTQMICEPTMHARKSRMASLSSGVIALPGGVGTLEELTEIITWRKLNLYRGQIVILNIDDFYTPLLQMLERTVEQGFMHAEHRALWRVATTPQTAVSMALEPVSCMEFTQTIS
ncbi:MAG: TIGR00730 family Rossman fold protein [Paramuribaculum sp.]|nr:TIGR00730 family Rossman fold protein [Paramuribaculum sp.]